MLGIKESKEMVSFIASLINGIGKSMEDGSVTWWDARHFVDAFQKASPAMKQANEIIGEIKDYSDEERIQLINLFAEECDLPFETGEQACEWAFTALINLSKTVQFIKVFKDSKAEEAS